MTGLKDFEGVWGAWDPVKRISCWGSQGDRREGMHKEVHRVAFQSIQLKQGELYQAYVAKLKPKVELFQYMMVAPVCKNNLCNCSGHKRQLYYRDEMVGT